jgi:hypothetical protein
MAVRIMTYIGLLYQDLIKAKQLSANKLLPPVLPIVLYNGDPAWTAATDISDLIQHVPGGLADYRPTLRYLLLAERDYSDEQLRELNNLVSALFRLENSRTPAQLLEVVVNLLQWLSSPKQDSLRRAFTVWFSRVLFPDHFDSDTRPALEELYEVKNMLAERVKEWNKESLERGLQKGRQEGRQEGAYQLLKRQLETKFGELPPPTLDVLQQADEEQILLWSERILSADTLGDIFGH